MTYRPVRTNIQPDRFAPLSKNGTKTVHLDRGAFTLRDYTRQSNPPILHRKELLLPLDDPRREGFVRLTEVLEADGLFQDTRRIGYRRQWEALLAEKGWSIAGHVAREGEPSERRGLKEELTKGVKHSS